MTNLLTSSVLKLRTTSKTTTIIIERRITFRKSSIRKTSTTSKLINRTYIIFINTYDFITNFICIQNNLLKKFDKILNNYQISINRIVSFKYLKNFLDPNLSDIFTIALKVTKGLNENEAIITSRNRENQGFFEKFFNFFN